MSLFESAGVVAFTLLMIAGKNVSASEWPPSNKTDQIANPLVVMGFNPVTQILTGYVSAVRIAPGRTDECRFVFFGNLRESKNVKMVYIDRDDGGVRVVGRSQVALLDQDHSQTALRIQKPIDHEDCDWILPFIGEPHIKESARDVSISLGEWTRGAWIGVHAIKSERAYFYQSPASASSRKSFLVTGDVVYVYKTVPDWCYVKFKQRGKTTEGWLRKSDLYAADE